MAHAPRGQDMTRIISMRNKDIDYSDIPPLDDAFFKKATMVAWPPVKRQVTVRLDADVLRWLKASGKGYQTRLNYILRAAMEHQGPRRPRATKRRRPHAA